MTKGKILVIIGKTFETDGKTLVTKGKALVINGEALVTKRKAMVIRGKKNYGFSKRISGIFIICIHIVSEKFCDVWLARSSGTVPLTLAARVRL